MGADIFESDKAYLGIYTTNSGGRESDEIQLSVTDVLYRTKAKGVQSIVLEGSDAIFEALPEGDFEVTPIELGSQVSGSTVFGTGIKSSVNIDTTESVSFYMNFSQRLPDEGWFAIVLGTGGYQFDPANNDGKGITFLAYQKGNNAIQLDGNPDWSVFQGARDNLVTIRKGSEAWELYLQNANPNWGVPKLVSSIPFSKVSENVFDSDPAKLIIYSYSDPVTQIAYSIKQVTHVKDTEKEDEESPLKYQDKTFIIPTNDSYWTKSKRKSN